MDIRFQSATAHGDVELVAYARRRLLLRLQHCSDRLDRINVKLVDAADHEPQRDSFCIVSVKLHGSPAATVVDVGVDVQTAIDRAVDRAGRLAQEQVRQADSPQASQTQAVAA